MYRVFKDLQSWKEAPLDCVLLVLYQLQAFYYNEIKRGLTGMGEYNLAPQYASLRNEGLAEKYLPTRSPNDIVKSIRESKFEVPEVDYDVLCIIIH